MNQLKKTLLALSVIGLQACGGGGGGGSSTPALSLDTVQGVYDTTTYSDSGLGDATKAVRAVVLRDGSTWLFLRDGPWGTSGTALVGVAKASVTVSGQTLSGTGKRYMPADESVTNLAVTGNVPAASTLSLSFSDSAGGTTTATATAAMDSRFSVAAEQAHIEGTWTFTSNKQTNDGGIVQLTWAWTVNSAGALSGTNSEGCSFTGTVLPHAGAVAVFDAKITATCPRATVSYEGVAFQNIARDGTTFGLILNDGSKGTVVEATKADRT